MSKKEIYVWASFGSTTAILGYYLITVFGLSEAAPEVTARLESLFVRVFLIAFVIEIGLDVFRSINKKEIYADERDKQIEARGTKNAYYFLVGAIFVVAGHEILNSFFGNLNLDTGYGALPYLTVHLLFVSAFLGMMIKSATQLFFYLRG
ncbi:MAG: hypothetical protein FH748_11605 [Balneolaceae bacterium]|nr:hypothetical protein [Balneolaceae bacterium]